MGTVAVHEAHSLTGSRLTGSADLCMPRFSAGSTRSPPVFHPNYIHPFRDHPSSSEPHDPSPLDVTFSSQTRGIAQQTFGSWAGMFLRQYQKSLPAITVFYTSHD